MTIEVVSPPGLFIVLTITKRAHYKAKSEATCRVSVLKLVSPNRVGVRVRVRVREGLGKYCRGSSHP